MIELVLEVESKERLLNPEEIISLWGPTSGSWVRLVAKHKKQDTPTTSKRVLPGERTTCKLLNQLTRRHLITAHQINTGYTD